MPTQPTQAIIGRRYRLHDQLGAGAMGAVYRATDRLTGRRVALKKVLVLPESRKTATCSDEAQLRLALAQEFQSLASLRHPHIIGVHDYGFSYDANRQPYFTMDLLENAQTILEAGQGQLLSLQVDLLVQLLQALAYLHRRGIVHRDLKPSNVLVVADPAPTESDRFRNTVRVVDFGISMAVERAVGTLGTLAYMAPEVLDGHPAGIVADLYAVGVMAYELLTNQHPFDTSRITALVTDIMNKEPDVESIGLEPQLALILKRLLAKEPTERYAEAGQVIDALAAVVDQPLVIETEGTRESFLQAARLVGREPELEQLSNLLAQVMAGHGSAWLVGGESGVGKSRLLNEFRPLALVQGALVLRGQSVREGSTPYHLWRSPLRSLCLLVDLDDLNASVLKPLMPDIGTLLERDVPDAPELDPQAAQPRLLTVIEHLFSLYANRRPMILILEDLHWAGDESLVVLARLSRIVEKLPLLIIGSYRDDERPDLPASLPQMKLLKLNRLSRASIADLSGSMLGRAGRQKEVLDLLQRETEGNVFFLVEVVRALAEEAGRLDRVSEIELPRHVITGGVRRIIQRRLNRVPKTARPLLQVAAIMGRHLDLAVLRQCEPDTDLEKWLSLCADAAVLDVLDDRWRFAHDKLRDGLLANLGPAKQQVLHRRAAEAIEVVHRDLSEHAAALAHHWGQAGNGVKEGYYAAWAGEQASKSGAYQEAITFLERALVLAKTPEAEGAVSTLETPSVPEQVRLKRQLGEAHLGLGNMLESQTQLEQALMWLGWAIPDSHWGLRLGLLKQVLRQAVHLLWPARFLGRAQNRGLLFEVIHIGVLLGLIYYLARQTGRLLYVGLQSLNLGQAAGPSPNLARSYANMCVVTGLIPIHPLARVYGRRALETAQNASQPLAQAWVLTVTGVYSAGVGHWSQAEDALGQAVEICSRLGDRRRWEESLSQLAMVRFLQGQYTRSVEFYDQVYTSAHGRGDPQLQAWGLNGKAANLLALGQDHGDEVSDLLETARKLLVEDVGPLSGINTYALLAQVRWRQGKPGLARQAADQAAHFLAQAPRSSHYILPGYANVAAVYLGLWELAVVLDDRVPIVRWPEPGHFGSTEALTRGTEVQRLKGEAKRICSSLRKFARVFPIAQPQAWLCQGRYDWLVGKATRARKSWQQSLSLAERLAMPREQGLAHFEIGRHLPVDDPARQNHLTCATEIFAQLKTSYDLERVRVVLGEPGQVRAGP